MVMIHAQGRRNGTRAVGCRGTVNGRSRRLDARSNRGGGTDGPSRFDSQTLLRQLPRAGDGRVLSVNLGLVQAGELLILIERRNHLPRA